MLFDLPRPTIFAHRGASAHAPENTLAAFEHAVRQNAHGIELDAMLCGDGQVVVIHNDVVNHTTDGTGRVRELSLEALKEFDAGSWFDERFCGEKIPTLSEVFEAVGKNIVINIELKNLSSPHDMLPEKVAELIMRHNFEDYVLISSFNPLGLRRFKKSNPHIPVGMLADKGFGGWWARNFPQRWLTHETVHPHLQDATREFIGKKQTHGLSVNVYTVNHPEDIRQLTNWGVDGIITDDPLVAHQTLETESRQKVKSHDSG